MNGQSLALINHIMERVKKNIFLNYFKEVFLDCQLQYCVQKYGSVELFPIMESLDCCFLVVGSFHEGGSRKKLLGSASLIQCGKYICFSHNSQVLKNAINIYAGTAGTKISKVLPELRV